MGRLGRRTGTCRSPALARSSASFAARRAGPPGDRTRARRDAGLRDRQRAPRSDRPERRRVLQHGICAEHRQEAIRGHGQRSALRNGLRGDRNGGTRGRQIRNSRRRARALGRTNAKGRLLLRLRPRGGRLPANRSRPHAVHFGVTWIGGSNGDALRVTGGQGQVTSPAVQHVELLFADGSKTELSFVWVSAPIAAGFFTFVIPAGTELAAVIALDASGKQIARNAVPPPMPLRPMPAIPRERTPPVVLPSSPPIAPSAPIQRGRANGVSVTSGRNGAVLLDVSNAMARLARAGSSSCTTASGSRTSSASLAWMEAAGKERCDRGSA